MSKATFSEFYARAVFEIASQKSQLEKCRLDLRRIAGIAADAELVSSLRDPELPLNARKALMEERLGDVSETVMNLVFLLADRDKVKIAPEISQEYDRLLDAHYGIEHARVVSAVPLDERDRETVSSRLEQMTGRKFALDVEVDPDILGGLVIKIGDMLVDRSLRGRLEALRGELTAASPENRSQSGHHRERHRFVN